jgi:hypothetical protein
MSFISKGHSINCNSVTLGGIYADSSDTINIRHSDPNKNILVNGILPSAGGGGGGVTDPLNLNNINAAVAMTTPSITPPAAGGGLVIKANGLLPPDGAGETLNINASTVMTLNGDISTMNGNVQVQGTGAITCGTTINAVGNITTNVTGDINSGRDFIFNGQDLYKSYPGVVPAIPNKTYKDYKGLVATSDNAIFTAEPVFRKTIKVQTSDGAVPPVLTDRITLNSNGTIQCANINNVNEITTGTVVCDNGATNECKARVFNTRTSGTNGWTMKQALEEANAPGNKANNILQFAATQAQVAGIPTQIYVTASDYDPSQGDEPSVIIDPATTASGGRVQSSQFITGTTASRFVLKQDIGGPLDEILQVNAPSASAEVRFKDNVGQDKLRVTKNAIILGSTIPLSFGSYSFAPRQLYRDITAFSFNNSAFGSTNIIFSTSNTDWVNVNTGATGQSLNVGVVANRGAYKLTFRQTSAGSLGQINDLRILSDIVLSQPNDGDPNITLPSPSAYAFEAYDGTASPIITVTPGSFVFNIYAQFPGVTGNETSNIRITLTQMPYFA